MKKTRNWLAVHAHTRGGAGPHKIKRQTKAAAIAFALAAGCAHMPEARWAVQCVEDDAEARELLSDPVAFAEYVAKLRAELEEAQAGEQTVRAAMLAARLLACVGGR